MSKYTELTVEKRIEQIRENRRIWYGGMGQVTQDIDFLLSIVKGQEAWQRCGECDEIIEGSHFCFVCIQVLKEKKNG